MIKIRSHINLTLKMNLRLWVIAIALCSISKISAQQIMVSGADTSSIKLFIAGLPNVYPAQIPISGGHRYLKGIQVLFPSFYMDGDYADLDILLEAPSGKRVMLMSDYFRGFEDVQIDELWFDSKAADTLPTFGLRSFIHYRPANFGTSADTFPAPGPGVVQPKLATFNDLINENPNGTWRLWVVDDSPAHSYFTLLKGWRLNLETSPVPICVQPELPKISGITDSTAVVSWESFGAASQWDILWQSNSLPNPSANTPATVQNWGSKSFTIKNLPPDDTFRVYVRSACQNGDRSLWVGPVVFRTIFTPCFHAIPISTCQKVNCSSLPSYSIYPYEANCISTEVNTQSWIFRFTAPETGTYWINFEAYSWSFPHLNWFPDNLPNCSSSSGKCFRQQPTDPSNRILDTLIGGTSYIIIIENYYANAPVFRLSRCPTPQVMVEQVKQDPLFEPFSATFNFWNIPPNEPTEFDFFYTTDSLLVEPDANARPSVSGVKITPSIKQTYRLPGDSLKPASKYRLWLRSPCDSTLALSCWTGPIKFETATFCGTFTSVRIDSVTDRSAKIQFISPVGALVSSGVHIKGTIGGEAIQIRPVVQGQLTTLYVDNLTPDTTYELGLKASCYPDGFNNPSYAFTFKTLSGCFMDVRDVQNGERVTGQHFENGIANAFQSRACLDDWDYTNINEYVFRYKATKTCQVTVWPRDVGSLQVQWFYKDAALGCNRFGITSMGCVINNNKLFFQADSGKTYLLLADGARWNKESPSRAYDTDFIIYDCTPPCSAVDSLMVVAKTSTTATLRWRNAGSGAKYYLHYDGAGANREVITTDTVFTLTNLSPSASYRFYIENKCSGSLPGQSNIIVVQLSDILVKMEYILSRCNPLFVLPNDTVRANYEIFELTVPKDGNYRLISDNNYTFLYEGNFDATNSTTNLRAAVINYGGDSRFDTLLLLRQGIRYQWVVTPHRSYPASPSFNDIRYKTAILIDGPVAAQIGAPQLNGVEYNAHGKVPFVGGYKHTGTCRDTSGWVHYYKIANNGGGIDDDELMLSVQLSNDVSTLDALPLVFSNNPPGATLVKNPPARFVQNPSGWYEMNRYWLMENLLPAQQIDKDFKIRFYYTQRDFELMRAAITPLGGRLDSHEAMYFHKINGFHRYEDVAPWYQHANVPGATAYNSTGYWSYANGPEATTSTWRHGQLAGEHYAEMVVRGFSGGGGSASVNGRNVANKLTKTTEIALKMSLWLLPNPNLGLFTLELSEAAPSNMTYRVADLVGRIVSENPINTGSTQQSVQITDLPNGLYFLQVLSEGKKVAEKKFVKQ